MNPTTFADVECACLPAGRMGRLASLRCQPGVEIALHDRDLWLRWPAGHDEVAGLLFALGGARLFSQREGRWYAWGRAIPAFDVPGNLRYRPLEQVILPERVEPLAADSFAAKPMTLRLVPDDLARPTLAMRCSLSAFWTWAETMPACVLLRYRAALGGARLFVLGKKLPWIEGSERFWGRRVLIPLGYRPDPNLSETSLRLLSGTADSNLLVLHDAGCETIPQDHFTPLTHAALRLALAEVKP